MAATPSSLSGECRNPRRLPRCPNARELPRMPPPLRRIPEPTSPSPMSECPRVATNAATPSRLSGECRPRHLSGARMPGVATNAATPSRLSGECRNPRHLSGARMPASCHECRHPLPSFRRMPEPTSPSPVSECPRVATNAATPSSLSGECRNSRRLHRCPNARELPRMPPPPPVFPANAGTHVVFTDVRMPASCHGCRHPLQSFRQKPEPTSPLRCPHTRELPRMPPPPPVFPAKAGTHVASPVPACPRVGVKARSTSE